MCGHKMPVSGEESETEDMASENGDPAAPEEAVQEFAFKNKYRELKSRLKYLVYVSLREHIPCVSRLTVIFPPPRDRSKSATSWNCAGQSKLCWS